MTADPPLPRHDRYDVVVIGGGLAGLTCGALLAKGGMRVLVAEQRPAPGGVCHSFQRDGFTFDVGPHLLSGCRPGGPVHEVLASLGVASEVEFLPIAGLGRVVFPDWTFEVPTSYEAFVDRLVERFPGERQRLLMLFREMEQVYAEIGTFPWTFGIRDLLKVPLTGTIFAKNASRTFGQMMEAAELADERLKAAVGALWALFGLPPSRISAVFWSVVMMSYFLQGGGSYPKGGLSRLAEALARGLEGVAGELLLSTAARRILVERGRVAGVELADVSGRWTADGRLAGEAPDGPGFVVQADRVVSAADARQTFLRLVGREHLPTRFVAKLAGMEPSLSLVKVAVGVEGGLPDAVHDTLFFDGYDMEAIFERMRSEAPASAVGMTVPTVTDRSLAPAGAHCLYLWNCGPFEVPGGWAERREEVAGRMIEWAERFAPGLRERIRQRTVMTPPDFHDHLLADQGAPYGWTFTPAQIGFGRLQPRTPVKGLYLAGHWTTPGAGVAGVIMSGRNTAEIVAAREGFAVWRRSA